MKHVIGKDGVVVNVVNAPEPEVGEIAWLVDDAVVVSVGQPFDPKDPQIDAVDVAVFRALHNINNRVRVLEGQAALTLAQSRAAFKALIP